MRYFDYRKDYSNINIEVDSYIREFIKELNCLIEMEGLDVYRNALNLLKEFSDKYPDLYSTSQKILGELLSNENPIDGSSKTGVEFQKDLYRIFELEESLSKLAEKKFEEMTPFEEIENGGEFMVVGHASYQLPGVSNNPNYRKNQKEYLSCSLFSNNHLNTFMDEKIVYLVDVTKENFVSASHYDVVTRGTKYPSIHSLKEVETDEGKEYIDVGFTLDKDKYALSIATPKVVERLTLEREKQLGNPSVNEIVLLRGKTVSNKALLVADETDLLLDEFMVLRKNNIDFKCINKGLYNEEERYDKSKLEELDQSLSNIGIYGLNTLQDYYKNVVLKMNYSNDVLERINNSFSKYIDINVKEPEQL